MVHDDKDERKKLRSSLDPCAVRKLRKIPHSPFPKPWYSHLRMIFLRGKQLQAMYKPCYLDAQASTNKPSSR